MIGIGRNLKPQPGFPVRRSGASLEFDFTQGTLNPVAGAAPITFARATPGWYFNAAGVLTQAAAHAPRFDYDPATLAARGLLIEEQRTNMTLYSGNSGAVLGVVGSGGNLPTGWSTSGDAGITVEVVAVSTENGIPYTDIRFSGTAQSNFRTLAFSNITGYITGTSYAQSAHCRKIAGTMPSVVSNLRTRYNLTAGGSTDITANFTQSAFDGASLAQSRLTNVGTTAGAITGTGSHFAQFNWVAGNVIDFTIRIGGIQLEAGGFASSYIPTAGATVTRNADVAVVSSLAEWFNPAEGSILTERGPTPAAAGNAGVFSFDRNTGDSNEAIYQYLRFFSFRAGSANQAFLDAGTAAELVNGINKQASAYKVGEAATAINGTNAVTSSSPVAVPSGLTRLVIGGPAAYGLRQYNGCIRRLAYFPRRLSNVELKAYTQ